jgi:hypothetical protein
MAAEPSAGAGENPLASGIPATVSGRTARIASSIVTKLLLSIHVLAAIIAIGPVTVAASMFPAATRRVLADPTDQRAVAVLRNLHRICRVYAALGIVVPVFGLATGNSLGVLTDAWLLTSIVLTAASAAVLGLLVLPGQERILRGATAPVTTPSEVAPRESPIATAAADHRPGPAVPPGSPDGAIPAARLGMVTGVFNVLWAVVVVLMIVRPGSTTGA